jgi:hypothetical protein
MLSTKGQRTRSTARSKLTQAFVERLAADFNLYGEEVIAKLREDSPAVYAQVIAKLCPAELLVQQTTEFPDLEEMSRQELRDFMIEEMKTLYGVRLIEGPEAATDGKAQG